VSRGDERYLLLIVYIVSANINISELVCVVSGKQILSTLQKNLFHVIFNRKFRRMT
jgi:hypothetical protein